MASPTRLPIMSSLEAQFARHVAWTSDAPLGLTVERAEGPFIELADGRRLIDFISGIAVSSLGHRHPRVVEKRPLGTLDDQDDVGRAGVGGSLLALGRAGREGQEQDDAEDTGGRFHAAEGFLMVNGQW